MVKHYIVYILVRFIFFVDDRCRHKWSENKVIFHEMEFKKPLDLRAGAQEYWVCNEDGRLRFFTAEREVSKSVLCPSFPSVIE